MVCDMVLNVFAEHDIDPILNQTLITLIPKVEVPELISEFGPISLLTVLFKLITKVIVNRMTKIMQYVIAPTQVSFIIGRSIIDYVIVVQESFHSMNTANGKTGWMAIKVDLETAYDRLRWDFLEDSVIDLGLPSELIRVVMNCVSTASFQIASNGNISKEFLP